ncbi:hypothetical protein [Nocardia sp. NPDC050175]|uniref:hypothetical protein n=1 Tax=Nocardia sp. NPDC050175 TaxID=3364317 RepID=UPI0037B57A0A
MADKMNSEPAVVMTYGQLIDAFNVLIDHVRRMSPDGNVSINDDYFWSVPVAEMNNVYSDPPGLTVGQISESWSNVAAMIANEDIVSYGLIWLADVLRAIGKETNG